MAPLFTGSAQTPLPGSRTRLSEIREKRPPGKDSRTGFPDKTHREDPQEAASKRFLERTYMQDFFGRIFFSDKTLWEDSQSGLSQDSQTGLQD
jgi:hypothetical protein